MVDKPTVTIEDYLIIYRLDGLYHRENGPAISDRIGSRMEWYFAGLRHREDGPAVIEHGYWEYWLNGNQISQEEFYRWKAENSR